ncbi:MAG: hypothetical protein PUK59_00630 [Actinomycetaceae bacterium]|nr:hypothetical protein [Actinomycetaceae bacterium]MDY5854579.1 hypothetical protein [Arcanobacterium sp.]
MMRKTKAAFIGVICAAALSLTACGASTPAPTLSELKSQAQDLMEKCMRNTSDECTKKKDTFCDGLEAYIDKQGAVDMNQLDMGSRMGFLTFGTGCSGVQLK